MAGELERVIAVVCSVGKVSGLAPDQDFYEAGVSSISALSLLMELESQYQISIPDDEFIAARTARALHELVARLQAQATVK